MEDNPDDALDDDDTDSPPGAPGGEPDDDNPSTPDPTSDPASSSSGTTSDDRVSALERELAAQSRTMQDLLERVTDGASRGDVSSIVQRHLRDLALEEQVQELVKVNTALTERLEAVEKAGGIAPRTRTNLDQWLHKLWWRSP